MKTAVINISNNIVENIIELENLADLKAPDGFRFVQDERAEIGTVYDGNEFIKQEN